MWNKRFEEFWEEKFNLRTELKQVKDKLTEAEYTKDGLMRALQEQSERSDTTCDTEC